MSYILKECHIWNNERKYKKKKQYSESEAIFDVSTWRMIWFLILFLFFSSFYPFCFLFSFRFCILAPKNINEFLDYTNDIRNILTIIAAWSFIFVYIYVILSDISQKSFFQWKNKNSNEYKFNVWFYKNHSKQKDFKRSFELKKKKLRKQFFFLVYKHKLNWQLKMIFFFLFYENSLFCYINWFGIPFFSLPDSKWFSFILNSSLIVLSLVIVSFIFVSIV